MMRALIIASAVLFAGPVWASQCAPRITAVEQLADKYGEARQGAGLSGNSVVVEVFVNEETGSWTIIVTNAKGIACMVASGTAFEWINSPSGSPT